MPVPYSLDLRSRVFHSIQSGLSPKETAEIFNVSISFIQSLERLYDETGKLSPREHGGGNPAIIDEEGFSYLEAKLKKTSDLTLEELCFLFEAKFNKPIAVSTMDQSLRNHGITRKKKVTMIQN